MRYRFIILSLISFVLVIYDVGGKVPKKEHPLDAVYYKSTGGPGTFADDFTLIRRMSLHLRGSIPTMEEIQAFTKSDDTDRIEKTSASFISDREFAEYWGTYFGSLFRDKTKVKKTPHAAFYKYLAKSIHENKPYDKLVVEMLTSSGDTSKNPATLFYIRDSADPLQVAEYVGRVFYAKRVSCARCHDHPYDNFSRRDYYGLAAFFTQQYVRDNWWDEKRFPDSFVIPGELKETLAEKDVKVFESNLKEWNKEYKDNAKRKAYEQSHELTYATLYFQPRMGIRFPRSDSEPGGDLVSPRFPDGSKTKVRDDEDRRAVFATWLTDRKNDRFRKALINRVWTRLIGWSFFPNADDWSDQTKIEHADILNHLDQVFVEKDYRIKDLVHYIVTSQAYRRSSQTADQKTADVTRYFPPKRLDADQFMNSMIRGTFATSVKSIRERAAILDTLDLQGRGEVRSPNEKNENFTSACEVDRPAHWSTFLSVFGAGPRRDIDDDEDNLTIEQVMTLLNGRLTGNLVKGVAAKDSFLRKEYERTKNMDEIYHTLFWSLLGRPMTPEEENKIQSQSVALIGKKKEEFKTEFVQDLAWALINSQEFIHNR